jgi:hypothetical protein
MKHGPDSGPVQAIKFSGAMRILEKGEKSGGQGRALHLR